MQNEIAFGIALAIFAAALGINDLVAGRYGDDEAQYINERSNAYFWYQAKSIKESLVEGQRDLLASFPQSPKDHIDKLNHKIAQYKKEKQEILLGSKQVGPEGYAQAINGELGKITGAKELEKALITLGKAGDRFDIATLFFQISLVVGAVGLIIKSPTTKKTLLLTMITLGSIGIIASTLGYHLVQNYS